MPARPLLLGLASASRVAALSFGSHPAARRCLHQSLRRVGPSVASTAAGAGGQGFKQPPPNFTAAGQREDSDGSKHAAFLGEADSNDGHDALRDSHGAPAPPLDATNAAFLGEADSDDAFEVKRETEGDKHEPLDPKHAAFLGEADSDDAFEARKAAEGDKHEPLDARNAAFLGEADSDDGFEADVEVHPEKHSHKLEDTSPSGLHGQVGELDQ
ncbi:hypothetical protein ABEF93_000401 [Exophiala dermatitidis]